MNQELLSRYTYIFDDEITQETVQECIDIIHMHPEVDLWISTEGGESCIMEIFIRYLNLRYKNINIYLTDFIASAGTFLLTDFKGKIFLSGNLEWIMFHKADRLTFTNRKSIYNDVILKKQLAEYNEKCLEKFRQLGLSEKELKQYSLGKDVFLYKKDFNRLNINNKQK